MSLAQTVRPTAGTRRVRARSSLSGARPRLIVLFALGAVLLTAQRVSAQQFFTATLTGAQQVPPVVSAGTGTGTVLLNAAETQITVNMNFSGLGTPAILGHIHGPADPTQNAGVLFDFAAFVPHATSGAIPVQTFAITPAQLADLKAGLYYFNVHSETFQGGEIRGQIVAGGQVFTTTLTGAQQVPQVISQGTGTGTVALNAAENQMFVNLTFSGLNTPAILAHIHGNG